MIPEAPKQNVMVDGAEQGLQMHARDIAARALRYSEDLIWNEGLGDANEELYRIARQAQEESAKVIAKVLRPRLQKKLATAVAALLKEAS